MITTDNTPEKKQEEYEIDTLTNKRLLSDHDYDGIRELDNDLPSWWIWLFIITIVFSIVYLERIWIFKAKDLIQEKEYAHEMAIVQKEKEALAEANFEVALLTDPASIASGKETWLKICAVCHLADGGGLVGPNMTDNYWIHGNTVADLYKTVEEGVIEKGMIPYKDQMSPRKRLEVVSFILNELVGSTPANPKASEGELYQ
ncbi:MAG: c-type cytochrome [Bacteroidales bacterium]|nr:c-type cytochrome [Bacteroidales bacterium]